MTDTNMIETAPSSTSVKTPKTKPAANGSATSGTGNIYTALIAAKGEMAALQKSADNPHFRSKYIDLESLVAATDDALGKHGLVVNALLERDENGDAVLRTVLTYAPDPAQIIESEYKLAAKDMTNPQAVGSAITYFRRYSLQAMLNLAAEDDDANAASATPAKSAKTVAPSAPAAERKFNTPAPGNAPSDAQKKALARMLTEAGYGSADAKQEASKKKYNKTLDQLDSRDVSLWMDELKGGN